MNIPVNSKVAKLLKEKGFDRKCTSFYDLTSNNQIDNAPIGNYNLTNQSVSLPTITEVVMWLYEKHGIWISVHSTRGYFVGSWTIHNTPRGGDTRTFDSPTEAYEAAIEYVLKNLI